MFRITNQRIAKAKLAEINDTGATDDWGLVQSMLHDDIANWVRLKRNLKEPVGAGIELYIAGAAAYARGRIYACSDYAVSSRYCGYWYGRVETRLKKYKQVSGTSSELAAEPVANHDEGYPLWLMSFDHLATMSRRSWVFVALHLVREERPKTFRGRLATTYLGQQTRQTTITNLVQARRELQEQMLAAYGNRDNEIASDPMEEWFAGLESRFQSQPRQQAALDVNWLLDLMNEPGESSETAPSFDAASRSLQYGHIAGALRSFAHVKQQRGDGFVELARAAAGELLEWLKTSSQPDTLRKSALLQWLQTLEPCAGAEVPPADVLLKICKAPVVDRLRGSRKASGDPQAIDKEAIPPRAIDRKRLREEILQAPQHPVTRDLVKRIIQGGSFEELIDALPAIWRNSGGSQPDAGEERFFMIKKLTEKRLSEWQGWLLGRAPVNGVWMDDWILTEIPAAVQEEPACIEQATEQLQDPGFTCLPESRSAASQAIRAAFFSIHLDEVQELLRKVYSDKTDEDPANQSEAEDC